MRYIGLTLLGVMAGLVLGGPLWFFMACLNNNFPTDWTLQILVGYPILLVLTGGLGNLVLGRQQAGFGTYYALTRLTRW